MLKICFLMLLTIFSVEIFFCSSKMKHWHEQNYHLDNGKYFPLGCDQMRVAFSRKNSRKKRKGWDLQMSEWKRESGPVFIYRGAIRVQLFSRFICLQAEIKIKSYKTLFLFGLCLLLCYTIKSQMSRLLNILLFYLNVTTIQVK